MTGGRPRISSARFLYGVFSRHEVGSFVFVSVRHGNIWKPVPIRVGPNLRKALQKLLKKYPAERYDIYFCPNAFSAPRLLKANATKTIFSWCDIDGGKPEAFEPMPQIYWESSRRRYQGIWIWNRALISPEAESLSRHFSHNFPADRTGWQYNKLLRVPGTINHKPERNGALVRLIHADWTPISPDPLLGCVKVRSIKPGKLPSEGWLARAVNRDALKLRRKYRAKGLGHPKVYYLLQERPPFLQDRSGAIYFMICTMAGAGVPKRDIACLVFHSQHFQSKHGRDLHALAAELSRCESKLRAEART